MFYFEDNFTIIWLLNNIFIIVFGIKQIMEEDILNYLPTVMFRETPCTMVLYLKKYHF